MEGLKAFENTAPKIVIYCRTVNLLGWLYEQFLLCDILTTNQVTKYIALFYILQLLTMIKKILNSLVEETDIHVVVATSALGCGKGMKNVMSVVPFGPAYDTVDFSQQIGRAGRVGSTSITSMCHAIFYTFPRYGTISLSLKSYIKSNDFLLVIIIIIIIIIIIPAEGDLYDLKFQVSVWGGIPHYFPRSFCSYEISNITFVTQRVMQLTSMEDLMVIHASGVLWVSSMGPDVMHLCS